MFGEKRIHSWAEWRGIRVNDFRSDSPNDAKSPRQPGGSGHGIRSGRLYNNLPGRSLGISGIRKSLSKIFQRQFAGANDASASPIRRQKTRRRGACADARAGIAHCRPQPAKTLIGLRCDNALRAVRIDFVDVLAKLLACFVLAKLGNIALEFRQGEVDYVVMAYALLSGPFTEMRPDVL